MSGKKLRGRADWLDFAMEEDLRREMKSWEFQGKENAEGDAKAADDAEAPEDNDVPAV